MVDTIRILWPDGSFSLGGSTDRIAYNSHGVDGVFTNAHEDHADTYASDGTFLFRAAFHIVEHFTTAPDGTTRVQFERGRLNLFHAC